MTEAQGTLEERLLAMYSHRGDGLPTQYVNPDGPDAVDEIASLRARVAVLERLLEDRDAFIVRHDLWGEFIDSTRQALNTTPSGRKGNGC